VARFCCGAMPASITIESASGLRAADWGLTGGSSDPYCICEIEGKSSHTIQTQVINNNLFPQWHHEGFLDEYEAGDTLLFTVWDQDWGKKDDLIGKAELKFEQISNGRYEGQLALIDNGTVGEAFLRVKVDTHGTIPTNMATAPSKELTLFSKTWTTREAGEGMRNDVNGEFGFAFTPNADFLVLAMGRALGPDADRLHDDVTVTLWSTKPQEAAVAKVKVGPQSRCERAFAFEGLERGKEPKLKSGQVYYLTQSCHKDMADSWFDGKIEQADLKGCMPKECSQIQGGVFGDKVGSFPAHHTTGLHRMGMLNLKLKKAPAVQDFDNFGIRERPERLAIRFVCMSPSP